MMKRAITAGMVAGAIIACGGSYSEQSTTTTTAASAPASESAIDTFASTRCDRETRCDNVGAGKRYVSRQGCTAEIRGDEMNILTSARCPRGVEPRALDKCLAEARGERGDNALDAFNRANSCGADSLCPR